MKTMRKDFLRMRLILLILITICVIASNVIADTVKYTYDDAGRLTKAYYGNGRTITYTYDKAGNIIAKKVTTTADPVPDIEVNGTDGPITPTGNLSLTVALDNGSHPGENADWWVAVVSPVGLYWFTLDGWIRSDTPISVYGGPLKNLPPYTIFEMGISTLPVGTYTFYFGVDMIMNGTLDMGEGQIYYDGVVVKITPTP